MAVLIEAIGVDRLGEYAAVRSVYEVRSKFEVVDVLGGMGGLAFSEQVVPAPYMKDYDAWGEGGPLDWGKRFDLSRWGFWIAREGGDAVGAAAVAWDAAGVGMLEGWRDVAVLWDIRVRQTSRLGGVGAALFREAARWAKAKGCALLKIETQNVNVGACRFYARMGCYLGKIERAAYRGCAGLEDEVRLEWYLDLVE